MTFTYWLDRYGYHIWLADSQFILYNRKTQIGMSVPIKSNQNPEAVAFDFFESLLVQCTLDPVLDSQLRSFVSHEAFLDLYACLHTLEEEQERWLRGTAYEV